MQLYLAIGIPSLLVILAWVSNRSDIKDLSTKIDHHYEHFNNRLGNHVGDFREFKGKVEALLGSEKKHTEQPVETHQ